MSIKILQSTGAVWLFAITLTANAATFNNDDEPWTIDMLTLTPIEAENYDTGGNGGAWFDRTLDNIGQEYRRVGPDIQTTSDVGGGYNVGWIESGEWLQYTIDVKQGGDYQLDIRVDRKLSSDGALAFTTGPRDGAFIGDDSDEIVLIENVTVPSTGDWQQWTTVSADIQLEAGVQTLQFDARSSGFDLNWIQLKPNLTETVVANVEELVSAAGNAEPGDVISMQAGRYELSQALILKSGVSLVGAGVGNTILTGDVSWQPSTAGLPDADVNFEFGTPEGYSINLERGGSGNVVRDMTLSGPQLHGAIFGIAIANIELSFLEINDFLWSGILTYVIDNASIHDKAFINAGGRWKSGLSGTDGGRTGTTISTLALSAGH